MFFLVFSITMIYIRIGQNIISGYALEQFGDHTPGYGKLITSGEVIDPINQIIELKNGVIDPDKYLRELKV